MPYPGHIAQLNKRFNTAHDLTPITRIETARIRTAAQAGSVDRTALRNLMATLSSHIKKWELARNTAGMADYARNQLNDQTIDIVAEFNAMEAAAISLRDWIFNNFPRGADDGWREVTYDKDGNDTTLTFNDAGELNAIIARTTGLIDTIQV